jgi:acyl-CoA thioester hydrolase
MTLAEGHFDGTRFVYPIRVYYEDTDAAGIVYYANYLKFAERSRTEFLRRAGIDQSDLRLSAGLFFAVRRAEVEYLRPARLDDVLQVTTQLTELTHVKIDALQSIRRGPAGGGSQEIARVLMRVVCLRTDGRPARMPGHIRDRFLPYVRPLSEALQQLEALGDASTGTTGSAANA